MEDREETPAENMPTLRRFLSESGEDIDFTGSVTEGSLCHYGWCNLQVLSRSVTSEVVLHLHLHSCKKRALYDLLSIFIDHTLRPFKSFTAKRLALKCTLTTKLGLYSFFNL